MPAAATQRVPTAITTPTALGPSLGSPPLSFLPTAKAARPTCVDQDITPCGLSTLPFLLILRTMLRRNQLPPQAVARLGRRIRLRSDVLREWIQRQSA